MIIESGTNEDLKVMEIDADCEAVPQFSLDPGLYPAVSHIDLSFNRIASLSGLEAYPNLETLILDNNCLTDELEFPSLHRLRVLSVNKNYISHLNGFLSTLQRAAPKLVYLSLLSNPACPTEMVNSSYTTTDYHRYRLHVVSALPTLRFLDSQKVTRVELNEATGRISPGPLDLGALEELYPTQVWRSRTSDMPTGSAKYGKILATYQGKNSEGNRFIRNRDL